MIKWKEYDNIKYYAIMYNINDNKIEKINILRKDLLEKIKKAYKKNDLNNLKDLRELINSNLKYTYHSRAEYETVIGGLYEKNMNNGWIVDVYYQVKDNTPIIADEINNKLGLNLSENGRKDYVLNGVNEIVVTTLDNKLLASISKKGDIISNKNIRVKLNYAKEFKYIGNIKTGEVSIEEEEK